MELTTTESDDFKRELDNFIEVRFISDCWPWCLDATTISWSHTSLWTPVAGRRTSEGRLLPSCPASETSQRNLAGCCVMQNAGSDGPSLVWSNKTLMLWSNNLHFSLTTDPWKPGGIFAWLWTYICIMDKESFLHSCLRMSICLNQTQLLCDFVLWLSRL